MNPDHKKALRAISLELRHILEGTYDERGDFKPGDLENRLNAVGVWRNRPAKPLNELTHLPAEDQAARQVIDAYLHFRAEAGVGQAEAVAEFVREAAYNWANRLLTLRCMEARGIIDEVILQKEVYGRRSLLHNRLGQQNPALLAQPDEGLFTVLLAEFTRRSRELPALFHPKAPAIALRPSLAALKKCIGLLSGAVKAGSYAAEGDELFAAPDALGWGYQYWNAEEKDRVFEKVRTEKGAKIAGADIIPATQLYTEPYMVKFLVQNSLGALWMGMHPDSHLADGWEYYVRDADRAPVDKKPVRDITFLDPACGSGHFHLEAFDLLYQMYEAEGSEQGTGDSERSPETICAGILNHNLYGIDIDERAIQIAQAALWMKAKEMAWDLEPEALTDFHHHFVATNIRLPQGKSHLEAFLQKHPEDLPLRPALETVFEGLENAHELGSLLQLEEPVEKELRYLQGKQAEAAQTLQQGVLGFMEAKPRQGTLPLGVESYDAWKAKTLAQLRAHFEAEAEAADLTQAFFGQSVGKGLALFDILARKYDVVAANPPYMGSGNVGTQVSIYVSSQYPKGKHDLYSAFILRCIQMTGTNGFTSMVTQRAFLNNKYFTELREHLLDTTWLRVLTDLGTLAFSEIIGEKVSVALHIICNCRPEEKSTVFSDLRNAQSIEQKVNWLLTRSYPMWKHLWVIFKSLPEFRIMYSASQETLAIFNKQLLWEDKNDEAASFAIARRGLDTCDVTRWTRFWWEALNKEGWVSYIRGPNGYRWDGGFIQVVRWGQDGDVLRAYGKAIIPNPQLYFTDCATFSRIGATGLIARRNHTSLISDSGSGVYSSQASSDTLCGILNSRMVAHLLRLINPSYNFQTGDINALPRPDLNRDLLGQIHDLTQEIRELVQHYKANKDVIQPSFELTALPEVKDLGNPHLAVLEDLFASAKISSLAGRLDGLVQKLYGVSEKYEQELISSVGNRSWNLPNLRGFSQDLFYNVVSTGWTESHSSLQSAFVQFSETELLEVNTILQSNYSRGHGNQTNSDNAIEFDEDTADSSFIQQYIPSEYFLDELAIALQIHPISVYSLLKEGIEQEGWRCSPEEKRLTEDRFTVAVLRLLGHRWPKQIEAGEPVPDWAEPGGVIPITGGILHQRVGQASLLAQNGQAGSLSTGVEREFAEIVGEKLADWLAGSFFTRHISQFKKRPIAWQLQTSPAPGQRRRGEPAFAALIYYHKLSADLLPTLRSQFVRDLVRAYETEQRTLRRAPDPSQTLSGDQEARLRQLEIWLTELHAFSDALQQVSDRGFGDTPALQATLRQYALDDAMQSLKSVWLGRLADKAASDALPDWQTRADKTRIHPALRDWIADAIAHLRHHCAQVGPSAPRAAKLQTDPDARALATIIGSQAKEMVAQSLRLAGDVWFGELDTHVLRPLLEEINVLKAQQTALEAARDALSPQASRALYENEQAIKSLKAQISQKTKERSAHRKEANELREHIECWRCPAAVGWTDWLGQQPLFDPFASLDGQRPPPQTVAEFVAQESRYAPDINDGVRVNIAPLQKAGLLAAPVLAAKELDKAIADRAEWRADERRWCREGKLPRPGWWL